MKTNFFLVAILSLILSSCSSKLTTFTEDIYNEAALTDTELSKVQFYLSQDLYLYSDISEDTYKKVDGKIELKGEKSRRQVFIPKGTQGAFIKRTSDKNIAVGFENNCDECFLVFGPNPLRRGQYTLLAKEWQSNYGIVTYDNAEYKVYTSDANTRIMIDFRRNDQIKDEMRTPAGRKVN